MADYTWFPTDDYVEHANVTRLARAHGVTSLAELRSRSVADIGWYWDAVVRDLGLPFRTPYRDVVDLSAGIEHPDWFVGGELNIADACLDRWAAEALAVIHEAEDGTTSTLTYRELAVQADRVSAGLRALGIGKGDAVALFLPMIPEAVVACYAVARLGAVLVPLFSGFAPAAIASRLRDAEAKAVIVADGTIRRRRRVQMKPLLDEALRTCPTVEHVVVVGNLGDLGDEPVAAGETSWRDLAGDSAPAEAMAATDTLLLAYTSGTTGRPKGAVHTHAGFRGRSDDVMNVAGKRLAPAEVESVLTKHPSVAEAAAVGVPDATKGEAVWAFWVPRDDAPDEDVSERLRELVAGELGKPFAPAVVRRVSQLPKTRSAKILRRAVRAAALGTDPGDLSGAENPEAVAEIRAAARQP